MLFRSTYSQINEGKEGLKCLSFNSAKIDEFSYVPDYEEQQQDIDIPLGQIRRKIDFKKMVPIVQLVFNTAWTVANADHRIQVDRK